MSLLPDAAVPAPLSRTRAKTAIRRGLVAVVVGLVGAFDLHADVVGLFLGQGGQLDAQTGQVQAGHFFVQSQRGSM